jgi:Uma2 family endonuclease
MEKEDLGQSLRDVEKLPVKWGVYEQILRVPYYAIFNRYQSEFKMLKLNPTPYSSEVYQILVRSWIPNLELSLGVYIGNYKNVEMSWLLWYNPDENWVLTSVEQKTKLLQE